MKGTGVFKEFKSFIARGNVMDLAVGVIIGGAFGLIVTSLVNDIVMPVVGVVFGGFDFSNYFLPLSDKVTAQTLAEARKQGAVFAYGNFLTVAINFVILAWIIFLMVKGVNVLRKQLEHDEKQGKPTPPPPADVVLLTEIRDLLKAQQSNEAEASSGRIEPSKP
nr:large conductance mechanosensitive channel protein MscL [Agrobacterium vitis]